MGSEQLAAKPYERFELTRLATRQAALRQLLKVRDRKVHAGRVASAVAERADPAERILQDRLDERGLVRQLAHGRGQFGIQAEGHPLFGL